MAFDLEDGMPDGIFDLPDCIDLPDGIDLTDSIFDLLPKDDLNLPNDIFDLPEYVVDLPDGNKSIVPKIKNKKDKKKVEKIFIKDNDDQIFQKTGFTKYQLIDMDLFEIREKFVFKSYLCNYVSSIVRRHKNKMYARHSRLRKYEWKHEWKHE
jgi:hypothetical protein